MRILLIEDDETLCQTIPFQLHQEGFSVDVATHGEDGLHFARERVHDLILLDRMLPGLDGMEVLRIMRREGIATPVIFLTALGQVGDRTQGLNSGADDYIVLRNCWPGFAVYCVVPFPSKMTKCSLSGTLPTNPEP